MQLLKLADHIDGICETANKHEQAPADQALAAEAVLAGGTGTETQAEHDGLLEYPVLYVSPCARYFGVSQDEAKYLARDCSQVDADDAGRAYRRLDATWFAWLVHRTVQACQLAHAGKIPPKSIAPIFTCMKRIRLWARHHMGDELLSAAINRGIPLGYKAPVVRLSRPENLKCP